MAILIKPPSASFLQGPFLRGASQGADRLIGPAANRILTGRRASEAFASLLGRAEARVVTLFSTAPHTADPLQAHIPLPLPDWDGNDTGSRAPWAVDWYPAIDPGLIRKVPLPSRGVRPSELTLSPDSGGVSRPRRDQPVLRMATSETGSRNSDPGGTTDAGALLDELAGLPETQGDRRREVLNILGRDENKEAARQSLIGRSDLPAEVLDDLYQALRPSGQGDVLINPRIRKILIANRGEIAVRVLRAIEKENEGRPPEERITPVVVYASWDEGSYHVRLAQKMGGEAYPLLTPAENPGGAYLNAGEIIGIARDHGVDAIHPGYGYLAEEFSFSEACRAAGIVFMGPPPEASRVSARKDASKRVFQEAGISVIPGTMEGGEDLEELKRQMIVIGLIIVGEDGKQRLKQPIRLKAVAGGAGRGQETVEKISQLEAGFLRCQQTAHKFFNDKRILAEEYLPSFIHIEAQILADRFGNVIHLGTRECTLQENHQKLVECSDAEIFRHYPGLREKITGDAVKGAKAMHYVGAGTVEFLVNPATGEYFAMELNARIQVEHPVTEMVTGVDIVGEQLRIARGLPLSIRQEEVRFSGFAVEVRIKAVDPGLRILEGKISPVKGKGVPMPFPGPVTRFRVCGLEGEAIQSLEREGIRIEPAVESGDEISRYADPMAWKVIAHAADRQRAFDRMRRVLGDIELERPLGPDPTDPEKDPAKKRKRPLPTDLPRQIALVSTHAVRKGLYDNNFVPKWERRGRTENLTHYPYDKEIRFSAEGRNFYVRVVGEKPVSQSKARALAERVADLTAGRKGKGRAPLLAPWVEAFGQSAEIQAILGIPLVHDTTPSHSVVVDRDGNLLSWAIWDYGHQSSPRVLLPRVVQATVKRTKERAEAVTSSRVVAYLRPSGENWWARFWAEVPGTSGGTELLPLTDEVGLPFVQQGELGHLHTFRGGRDLVFHLSLSRGDAHGVVQSVEILDEKGNTIFEDHPSRTLRHPWETISFLLAEWEEGSQEIPVELMEALLSIQDLKGDERDQVVDYLVGRPEAVHRGFFRLERTLLHDLTGEIRKRTLAFVREILVRRSLIGRRVLSVQECEEGSVLVRFEEKHGRTGTRRERTLVRVYLAGENFAGANGLSKAYEILGGLESEAVGPDPVIEIVIRREGNIEIPEDVFARRLQETLNESRHSFRERDTLSRSLGRITCYIDVGEGERWPVTFRPYIRKALGEREYQDTFVEDRDWRGLDPAAARSHNDWRWAEFSRELQPEGDPVYCQIMLAVARKETLKDRRLIGQTLVPAAHVERIARGGAIESIPEVEEAFVDLLSRMEADRGRMGGKSWPTWNRFVIRVAGDLHVTSQEAEEYVLGLCQKYGDRLNGLSLEKGIARANVLDPRAPGGTRNILMTITRPGLDFRITSVSRVTARVRIKDQVVTKSVWVNGQVYEKWLQNREGEDFVLEKGQFQEDRTIRAITSEEREKSEMYRRGLLHWMEIVNCVTDLPPQEWDVEADRLEIIGVKRDKTQHLSPDTGRLVSEDEVNPKEVPAEAKRNGLIAVELTRRRGKDRIPFRILLVGHPLANGGQLTSIEQATFNAAIHRAAEKGVGIDWYPNEVTGAGIDAPVIGIGEEGITIRSTGQRAAENLEAIAATIRDLILHCQRLGVPLNVINDTRNIGGGAYEAAEAAMAWGTPGFVIMTRGRGSNSLTGVRALALALGARRAADVPEVVKLRFPGGETDLAGSRILGANAEAAVVGDNLDETMKMNEAIHDLTDRDYRRDELSPLRTTGDDGQREESLLARYQGRYMNKKDQKEGWAPLLLDHDHPRIDLYGEALIDPMAVVTPGASPHRLNSRITLGRMGGETTMVIVSPGSFKPVESRVIAQAIAKASALRIRVVIVGTFTGFDADPRAMAGGQLEGGAAIAKALAEYEGPGVFIYNADMMAGGNDVVFGGEMQPGVVRQLARPGSQTVVIGGRPTVLAVHAGKVDAAIRAIREASQGDNASASPVKQAAAWMAISATQGDDTASLEAREVIRQLLESGGWVLTPESPLPWGDEGFESVLRAGLERAVSLVLDAGTSSDVAYEQGFVVGMVEPQNLRKTIIERGQEDRKQWTERRRLIHVRREVKERLSSLGIGFSLKGGGRYFGIEGIDRDFKPDEVLAVLNKHSKKGREAVLFWLRAGTVVRKVFGGS